MTTTRTKPVAQGELTLIPVQGIIPKSFRRSDAGPRLILGHSETGHHHVVESPCAQLFVDPGNPTVAYLSCSEPVDLVHLRPTDTHQSLTLAPGIWMVSRQTEYTPHGRRMVED